MNVKADFHSVEFYERTGNPLFAKENIALNLNRMSRMTNLCCVKFLLRGKFY